MALPSVDAIHDLRGKPPHKHDTLSLRSYSRAGSILSHSIRGIGSDSGRAFLALGVMVLRGMEDLDNNITLRRLSNEIRELSASFTPISKDSLETLLTVA